MLAFKMDKQSLRHAILAARPRDADPGPLRRRLAGLLRELKPSVVAGYRPLRTEPGGADLPAFLATLAPTILLPVLLPDRDLDWEVYADAPGGTLGVDGIARAQVVIVPAVAVDLRGYRLGRGGGSYDRALARVAEGARIVALLHDGELLPEVPHEAHDQRVHVVLTASARTPLDR
jgi:5-formyltetrahydrofolate cyclo-ligase